MENDEVCEAGSKGAGEVKLRSDREDDGNVGFFRYFFLFKHSGFREDERPYFYLSRLFWILCVVAVFTGGYFLYGYIDYRQNTTAQERAENTYQEQVMKCFDPHIAMGIEEVEKYCKVDMPDNLEELEAR